MRADEVSGALLSGVTAIDCYAYGAGGGFAFFGSTNVSLQSCTLYNNTALLGAGVAAGNSQLVLQAVNISGNLAIIEVPEEGGRRRKMQEAVRTSAAGASICIGCLGACVCCGIL